jgi:hypothetical protein
MLSSPFRLRNKLFSALKGRVPIKPTPDTNNSPDGYFLESIYSAVTAADQGVDVELLH